MSKTRANIRSAVRELLRDTNPQNYKVPTTELNDTINRKTKLIASELPLEMVWNTGLVTTASGTADYAVTLSSSQQIHAIHEVKRASDNYRLQFIDIHVMETLRQGQTINSGDPYCYTLVESAAQAVTIRLFPTPDSADTLDMLVTAVPGDFSADTDAAPLGEYAIQALECEVAAQFALKVPDLDIASDVISMWITDAKRAIYFEKLRINRQRRQAYVQPRSF